MVTKFSCSGVSFETFFGDELSSDASAAAASTAAAVAARLVGLRATLVDGGCAPLNVRAMDAGCGCA